jgi:hypothetical protein
VLLSKKAIIGHIILLYKKRHGFAFGDFRGALWPQVVNVMNEVQPGSPGKQQACAVDRDRPFASVCDCNGSVCEVTVVNTGRVNAAALFD